MLVNFANDAVVNGKLGLIITKKNYRSPNWRPGQVRRCKNQLLLQIHVQSIVFHKKEITVFVKYFYQNSNYKCIICLLKENHFYFLSLFLFPNFYLFQIIYILWEGLTTVWGFENLYFLNTTITCRVSNKNGILFRKKKTFFQIAGWESQLKKKMENEGVKNVDKSN